MYEQTLLAAHCSSLNDGKRLARFSGDHNPMHIDPVAASRMPAGDPGSMASTRYCGRSALSFNITPRFVRCDTFGRASRSRSSSANWLSYTSGTGPAVP